MNIEEGFGQNIDNRLGAPNGTPKRFFHLPTALLVQLLIVFLMLLTYCSKNEIEEIEIDFGFEFFPLEVGRTWIYEADSILFDPAVNGIAVDSIKFNIRERITDTLRDNLNNLVYRIEYAEKAIDATDWQVKFIYAAFIEDNRAIRSENNLDFIKLVFPLKEETAWNGIAFIDERKEILVAGEPIEVFKGWSSNVVGSLDEFKVEDKVFETVFEVDQANTENILELRSVKEWYAENIGLIFQEWIILDTQCSECCNRNLGECEQVPWRERAEKGFILRKKLIEYF